MENASGKHDEDGRVENKDDQLVSRMSGRSASVRSFEGGLGPRGVLGACSERAVGRDMDEGTQHF